MGSVGRGGRKRLGVFVESALARLPRACPYVKRCKESFQIKGKE